MMRVPVGPVGPWRVIAGTPVTDQLRLYASMARLEKIEKAIRVFYLDVGRFPETTEALARRGYIKPADLRDSWGRAYRLEFSAGGYQLVGVDREGRPRRELTLSRRFNPVQRLMAAGRPVQTEQPGP